MFKIKMFTCMTKVLCLTCFLTYLLLLSKHKSNLHTYSCDLFRFYSNRRKSEIAGYYFTVYLLQWLLKDFSCCYSLLHRLHLEVSCF